MELVPILSTIILVGTIATFILAVAAYILYKIREGRARESSTQVGYMQQEPHVLVAPEASMPLQPGQPAPASMYVAPAAQQAPVARPPQQQLQQAPQAQNPNSLFWEYTDEGFVPVNPQQEQTREPQARQQPPQQQQDEGLAWL
jgi:hypothetical protein